MRRPGISRKTIEELLIVALLLIGGLIRAVAYGDLRLSVGNVETPSYIASSRSSLFSWRIFAGKRLFTTNLIYKLANDPEQCKLLALSNPTGGRDVRPVVQPCFGNIALLQNILAILAWCYFAWTLARWLTAFPARVGVASVIMLFGFTPQIAEWESILSPESLSVTVFVALFALLVEIVLSIVSKKHTLGSRRSTLLIAIWLVMLSAWLFLRDVHLYTVPITLLMIGLLFFSANFRRQIILWVALGALVGLFVLGYTSAQASHRATRYPLAHSYEDYILPFPDRVAFFRRFGMPDESRRTYQRWLDNNGTRAYAAFLLTHPGFVIERVTTDLYYFRAEFVQQYFEPPMPNDRSELIQLGEVLHSESLAVYVLDFLIIAGLWLSAMRGSSPLSGGWAWLGSWYFLATGSMLFVGYFGDAEGARRHIYPAVEAFRLLMWVLLFVCLDRVVSKRPQAGQVLPSA